MAKCPASCNRTMYEMVPIIRDTELNYMIRIQVYYKSTSVIILEEYRLFDFNAIVAAFGGAMGLFLGFSCFSTGAYLIDILCTHVMKFCRTCK